MANLLAELAVANANIQLPAKGRSWGEELVANANIQLPAKGRRYGEEMVANANIPLPPMGRRWGEEMVANANVPLPPMGRRYGEEMVADANVPLPPMGRRYGEEMVANANVQMPAVQSKALARRYMDEAIYDFYLNGPFQGIPAAPGPALQNFQAAAGSPAVPMPQPITPQPVEQQGELPLIEATLLPGQYDFLSAAEPTRGTRYYSGGGGGGRGYISTGIGGGDLTSMGGGRSYTNTGIGGGRLTSRGAGPGYISR